MLIYEYRVVMPLSVDEYRLAQLYSVTDASKLETGGGEGVEIVANEPFSGAPPKPLICNGVEYKTGQYTHKILHLNNKLPSIIRKLAPSGSTEIAEKTWNAYPYVRTEYSNPYTKDNFAMTIETMHLDDEGTTENVHNVSGDLLQKRMIYALDIVNDPVSPTDYREDEDPTMFTSTKTGRGPLTRDWKDVSKLLMCAYKLVTVNFNWFQLQDTMESIIQKSEKQLFTRFHKQLYCWMDRWYGLSLEDIREIEEKTKSELDQLRQSGEVRGMVVS